VAHLQGRLEGLIAGMQPLESIQANVVENKSKVVEPTSAEPATEFQNSAPPHAENISKVQENQSKTSNIPMQAEDLRPNPELDQIFGQDKPSDSQKPIDSTTQTEPVSTLLKRKYPALEDYYKAVSYSDNARKILMQVRLAPNWIKAVDNLLVNIHSYLEKVENNSVWTTPEDSVKPESLYDHLRSPLANHLGILESYLQQMHDKVVNGEPKDKIWWNLVCSLQSTRDYLLSFIHKATNSEYTYVVPPYLLTTEDWNGLMSADSIDVIRVQSREKSGTHLHTVKRGYRQKNGNQYEIDRKGLIVISGGSDTSLPNYQLPPEEFRYKPKRV
jgi:hypothetical protein